ncbi:MAG: aspartate kinase [bacterium]|nr:aspartate kinase [bacterium]
MDLLVQKYGGTSVGTADRLLNVAKIVAQSKEAGNRVAVVLSAMSSHVKAEGTTSRLLEASQAAIDGGAYYKIIDLIEARHLEAIEGAIKSREIRAEVVDDVEGQFHRLKSFLDAINVIGEISPRSNDVIIGTGEKLSARIFTGVLQDQGIDAVYCNLESLIDEPFTEVNNEFCASMQAKLAQIVQDAGPKVPVFTGYFGFAPGGILRSVGRGYTDFTAALVAAGTRAKELQIWKEVDGIYSTDPRKVPQAKVLESITPEEAMELTYYGSEVIHPFTMEQVTKVGVPVRIKNTFDASVPGTLVDPNAEVNLTGKSATAVTVKGGVTILNVYSNRMLMAYGFMNRVFEILGRYEIIIDLIATSEVNISMTIDDTRNLDKAIVDLERLGKVQVKKNMAILSLVGHRMRQTPGIAGDMFSRLGDAGVNIELISQGASEINISCAIADEQADKALKAVHKILEDE